jgi:dTDP-4-dehydrorhamnose reductase
MTNVLVTGAGGQLALTIKELFLNNSDDIHFIFKNKLDLDVSNPVEVNNFFSQTPIDYCINCAAYTNVESAEKDSETAFEVNSRAVGVLAKICGQNNTILIHISTDYVFDGTKQESYNEDDAINPINIYGKSKAQGEQHILKNTNGYFIIRTSWLYSKYGHNFLNTVLKKITQNEAIKVVDNQIGAPTSCADLAKFIYYLIATRNSNYGIYHFVPNGETSWFGFANYIASFYNKQSLINPTKHFQTLAKRPEYSVLNNNKVLKLGYNLNSWQKGIDYYLDKHPNV